MNRSVPDIREKGRLFIFIAVLFLASAGPSESRAQNNAPGGTIKGRVVPPAVDLMEGLRRGKKMQRYDMPTHAMQPIKPYRLSEVAVVYIEDVPGLLPPSPPSLHPKLNQSQMVFRPLVLPVVAGTTVDFPNNDDLFHNVFSYSQPQEFDLGRYPQGDSKSVTFKNPGIVKVYCDIHSYMYASILVLDNPYFSPLRDDGSYSIAGVPAGTYDLSFWYGRSRVATKQVVVEEGETTIVDFP